MRKHTREKPYRCAHPGCGKRFMWKSSVTFHEANGHRTPVVGVPGRGDGTARGAHPEGQRKRRRFWNVGEGTSSRVGVAAEPQSAQQNLSFTGEAALLTNTGDGDGGAEGSKLKPGGRNEIGTILNIQPGSDIPSSFALTKNTAHKQDHRLVSDAEAAVLPPLSRGDFQNLRRSHAKAAPACHLPAHSDSIDIDLDIDLEPRVDSTPDRQLDTPRNLASMWELTSMSVGAQMFKSPHSKQCGVISPYITLSPIPSSATSIGSLPVREETKSSPGGLSKLDSTSKGTTTERLQQGGVA
eukprot:CAMPEP_0198729936 /NCGR_PEP_ID=MMETSP1475-20131203/21847_1 /TAXON_ID= ORGANISM="Unidentified sp., Strain CCMP1999" /NCGR_SAMPLE_ID=MMETSP1475 /ASSEMBLY_ACC=CAM_ASM_001111 /LENGTH=296 /DNA_ID=CAMNT_0044492663 /DNA_START=96 /DNA_END=989 /DNA_ORIENTATION=+